MEAIKEIADRDDSDDLSEILEQPSNGMLSDEVPEFPVSSSTEDSLEPSADENIYSEVPEFPVSSTEEPLEPPVDENIYSEVPEFPVSPTEESVESSVDENIYSEVPEFPVSSTEEPLEPPADENIYSEVPEFPVSPTEESVEPSVDENIYNEVPEFPVSSTEEPLEPPADENIYSEVPEFPVSPTEESVEPSVDENIYNEVPEFPVSSTEEPLEPPADENIYSEVSELPVSSSEGQLEPPVDGGLLVEDLPQNNNINSSVEQAESFYSLPLGEQSFESMPKSDSRILKTSVVSQESVLIPPPTTGEVVTKEPVIESNILETTASKQKEPSMSPMELKEALKSNFVDIKLAGKVDVSPILISKTVEMLLDLVKVGSERDMSFIGNSINNYFLANPAMKEALRRELKIFMSDSELPEFVSKRAMELLPLLGKTEQKKKKTFSTMLMSLSDVDEEEEEEIYTSDNNLNTEQIPIEEDLSHSVSDKVLTYLKTPASYDSRLETCKNMIESGISFQEYSDLIDFDLMKSGKRFFDRLIPAAKAILFSDRYEFKDRIEEARHVLFVSLLYGTCPDILKMECFETLKRSGYLDIVSANVYKKYAIVFVKNALLNKSSGAACRSLSDMISILIPGAVGRENFEGKNMEYLIDSYISLILKEKNKVLFEYAVDILNHLSFEDHSILIPLSARIQPVNYEKAIDVTELLVFKRNIWASSILIDAVGENYMDIRNKAVDSLSRCGYNMPVDYRKRAINLIFEKLEETYDEEKQLQYIESARNIDPVSTAEVLISRFVNSGFTDRKEIGNSLMGVFTMMSSQEFLELFKGLDNLRLLHNYLMSSHRDRFTVDFARQFIELYRLHYSNLNGEENWRTIMSNNSELVNMINDLWNLQF